MGQSCLEQNCGLDTSRGVGDIYQVFRVCEYAGAHLSLLNRVEVGDRGGWIGWWLEQLKHLKEEKSMKRPITYQGSNRWHCQSALTSDICLSNAPHLRDQRSRVKVLSYQNPRVPPEGLSKLRNCRFSHPKPRAQGGQLQ